MKKVTIPEPFVSLDPGNAKFEEFKAKVFYVLESIPKEKQKVLYEAWSNDIFCSDDSEYWAKVLTRQIVGCFIDEHWVGVTHSQLFPKSSEDEHMNKLCQCIKNIQDELSRMLDESKTAGNNKLRNKIIQGIGKVHDKLKGLRNRKGQTVTASKDGIQR